MVIRAWSGHGHTCGTKRTRETHPHTLRLQRTAARCRKPVLRPSWPCILSAWCGSGQGRDIIRACRDMVRAWCGTAVWAWSGHGQGDRGRATQSRHMRTGQNKEGRTECISGRATIGGEHSDTVQSERGRASQSRFLVGERDGKGQPGTAGV